MATGAPSQTSTIPYHGWATVDATSGYHTIGRCRQPTSHSQEESTPAAERTNTADTILVGGELADFFALERIPDVHVHVLAAAWS